MNASTTPQCRYCNKNKYGRITGCWTENCNRWENQTAAACFQLDTYNCQKGPLAGVVFFYVICGCLLCFLCWLLYCVVDAWTGGYMEGSWKARVNRRMRLDRTISSFRRRKEEEEVKEEEKPDAIVIT